MLLILTSFYAGSYIGKPFSFTDLIALVISLIIWSLVFYFYRTTTKRLNYISKLNKILLSFLALIIAAFIIGLITGEIQF
ncbi:hypothetical protein KR50_00350 [Jeotgalibacillus campisalis]|uniref:Uncharacterized protein n=1 Tax=Jeotgalibacillus campisalis TaxID=220754 RepID=A0A0C2W7Z7_9BACL|nr:hypothetical protein KR50_00350 [Jeotgalibacillus campisalis]